LIFDQGIALANWTFVNNVITGVNQGVAREAADIFIGNSVPVCFRFKLLLMMMMMIILLLPMPLPLLYTAAAALNPCISLFLQVFTHDQPSSQCTVAPPGNLNVNLVFANNSHEQSHVEGQTPAAALFLSSEGVSVEGNVLATDGPLAACEYMQVYDG
jgi:hypothetical protein